MTAFSLKDATILVHDQDLSGYSNQVTLAGEAEALEDTTFRSGGWRSRVGGLKSANLDVSGFWDPAPDENLFADIQNGTMNRTTTVSPTNDEGDVAYMLRGGSFSYSQFGDVGALAPFSLSMMNTSREGLIRGRYVKRPTDDLGTAENITATGAAGAEIELGAVASGQFLYATFHVFTAGTTITAVLESDDADTFAAATTQITFGPITTSGGTWATRVAGPITDTWYRLRVSAITGTFNVACAVGIG
jgi:hypothetical protein